MSDSVSCAMRTLSRFFLGGLTGAAVGLLYAPRSGEQTRELVRERMRLRLRDAVENARDALDRVARRTEELAGELEARAVSEEMRWTSRPLPAREDEVPG